MLCEDIHSALSSLLVRYDSDQIVVVCDAHIRLETAYPTLRLTVNEQKKNLDTVTRIWDFLFEHAITRKGIVIAVGGGVLTDIVGFATATYKRGVDYINVPTSLLAMVDASSGGKTGINYHGLKNAIGAFAHPVETLIWPQWLQTLPAKEFLSGFGEMMKTGLLENAPLRVNNERLWDRLLQYDLDSMNVEKLTSLIAQCIRIKKHIVDSDYQEKGPRKALNLGHTFGHALEEISGMPHGYAVVYGLIAELYLSITRLGCPQKPLQQLTQIMLHYYGKPVCKCSDRSQLIQFLHQDKKNERTAEINCTLIRDIGSPAINQIISEAEANEALEYLFSL